MFKTTVSLTALAAAALLSFGAQADTLAQWNFNASNLTPSTGAGTASVVGTTGSFVSGSGSTDVAATNQAWSTTNYAAQGTGDKTRGVQFVVSTLGFENISFSYDSRHSSTASANELVQYSIDGTTFVDLTTFTTPTASSALFVNGRTVDFSSISETDNVASLTIRIVSTFAAGTSTYLSTGAATAAAYGATGTMRYDMVTINGAAVTAVPEPQTYAMLLAGLFAVGFVARRRQA